MNGGEAERLGVLAERDRPEAAPGIAPHFGGGHLGVEQPWDLAGHEPRRMRPDPRLEVPVVEGAGDGERQLRIAHAQLQPVAAESRQRGGEIDRGVHAVEIHIAHSGVDVPGAAAHLLEPHRLVGALFDRPSRHRGQSDLRVELAVVEPGLPAPDIVDHPRGDFLEFARQPAFEHMWWLHEMVVGRDEHQVAFRPRRIRQQGDLVRLLAPHETGAVFHVVQRDACHPRALLSGASVS